MAAAAPNAVNFRDSNFADRIGWREIVVQSSGVEIHDSDAPADSISRELRNYPNDLINNPPHQIQAGFRFDVTSVRPISNAPILVSTTDSLDRTKDAFAALITASDLSWQFILVSLLLAMGLGALHAVSPGHGKTIMAAYLVGARGTVAQACLLGLTVTVTHTAGVLGLGVITLFASRYILPESLYPLLSLTSGILVIGMGIALAVDRWQILRHAEHAHTPAHFHEHSHLHQERHEHSHLLSSPAGDGLSWKSLVGLGLVGGLVPSTSALILLLSAISLQRIPFGIVLIVAFGFGMATVLVGAGILLVRASKLLEGKNAPARVMHWLPLLSAVVVIGAGIVVSVGAWLQLGAWRP
jgi:ABC-type nickel/cobalt efflux system permease component RcnA